MRQMAAMLVGYAIGTVQVLILSWVERRRRHRQALQTLKADLSKASVYSMKFDWGPKIESYATPRPPRVSSEFVGIVAATDFSLTDEFRGDNTQQGLLGLVHNLELLQRYRSDVLELLHDLRLQTDDDKRRKLSEMARRQANEYDGHIDTVLYTLNDAIRDVDRRLYEVRWYRQLKHLLTKLPEGENPAPITSPDDERLQQQEEMPND